MHTTWSALKELRVRCVLRSVLVFSLTITLCIGVVRKQLGIPFTGETKDTMRLVLADIHVTGVSTEYWHQWGDMGSKTYVLKL